jgi:hypothetical protein
LIEANTRTRLPVVREARENGSTTLSIEKASHTEIRTHGSSMASRDQEPKTDRVTEARPLIRETGLARGMVLAETLPVVIGHQLPTGAGEIWHPLVTHLVGILVVAGETQCSPGNQALLTVWIGAGETQKCRAIAEARVARACRRHPAGAAEAEDTPAVAVHEAAEVVVEAVAAEVAAEAAVEVVAAVAEGR